MKPILTIAALFLAFNTFGVSAGEARGLRGAQAPDAMKSMLTHHLSSFQGNDLDAVMSDYTEESILITADATFTGRAEIRGFFSKLMPLFPKQNTRFELDKMIVTDNLLFIVWHASTPTVTVSLGSDTFLVENGKIHRQTFVGRLEQVNPGR